MVIKIKYSKFNGLCKKRLKCDATLITITGDTFTTDAKAWIMDSEGKIFSISPSDIIKGQFANEVIDDDN